MNSRSRSLLIHASLLSASQAFVVALYRPLLPQFATASGCSHAEIGLIMSAFAILPLVCAVPAGTLVDHWGPRPLIAVGYVTLVMNGVLLWRAESTLALAFSQLVAGLGHTLIVLAIQTYVSTLGGRRDRESNFGVYAFSIAAGQLCAPILGGILADWLGYQTTFLLSGLLAVLPLTGAFLLKEANPARARRLRTKHTFPRLRELWQIFQRDGIKAAILASFSVMFAMGVREAFFPVYLVGVGFSATTIGLLLSVRAFASLAVRPFMARAIKVFGRRKLLLGSMFATAASILFVPLFQLFWPLAVLSVFSGGGTGFTLPLTLLSVSEQAGEKDRGAAMGLRLSGNRTANLTNPLVFGAVAESLGLAVAFVSAGLILVVCTFFIMNWRGVFEEKGGQSHSSRRRPVEARSD